MKFLMMYSGGKDSALALYRMLVAGHTPVALVTTVNEEKGRSWFHGMQGTFMRAAAQRIGVPLLPCVCTPANYVQAVEAALKKGKAQGAQACVFGDIDIAGHKQWNEERCKNVGLACALPLWQENRKKLVEESIAAGFCARIKVVETKYLDESFLGLPLTYDLMEKIEATGADVCGENGEYHTFVCDGPIFQHPLPVMLGDVVDFGTHKAIDFVWREDIDT